MLPSPLFWVKIHFHSRGGIMFGNAPRSFHSTQNSLTFTEAGEELSKLLGVKVTTNITSGDRLYLASLERDPVTTESGFATLVSGVIVGVVDHLKLFNITCKITLGYVVPSMPIRYVIVRGSYYDISSG